jgi:translocation and assembly module TamA
VKVEGLQGEQQANALALLAIYQERKDPELDATRILALHRLAPGQITDALAPFGLYRVKIEDSLTQSAGPDGTWVATYRVDPGPAIKIRSLDYQVTGAGADNPAFPKSFPMKVGDVLLHADYEKAKSDLRYAAASEGYLDYQLVRSQVLIDPVAYEALVEVHLDTGPQYYLGEVRFKQDLLDDDLLKRYVSFRPGDLYDPDQLVSLQARLLGTEYYDKVEVIPLKDPSGEDRRVPIEVVAQRNKANKYRVGVGYATDTGPRLTTDWSRRYWNRWGHRSRAQLILSPGLSGLELDYRIPIRDPLRDYVSIKPQVTYYDIASNKGWLSTVQVARSVVTPSGWRRTLGLDYRYEDYTINDVETSAANELIPYVTWSNTVTDNPVYTKRGYRAKLGILAASDILISPSPAAAVSTGRMVTTTGSRSPLPTNTSR